MLETTARRRRREGRRVAAGGHRAPVGRDPGRRRPGRAARPARSGHACAARTCTERTATPPGRRCRPSCAAGRGRGPEPERPPPPPWWPGWRRCRCSALRRPARPATVGATLGSSCRTARLPPGVAGARALRVSLATGGLTRGRGECERATFALGRHPDREARHAPLVSPGGRRSGWARVGGRPAELVRGGQPAPPSNRSACSASKGGAMKSAGAMSPRPPYRAAGPYRARANCCRTPHRRCPPRRAQGARGRAGQPVAAPVRHLRRCKPAAAASIGQVHKATWADGRPVAVKVHIPARRRR